MATITMQTMRYINMLDRTAKVKTSKCFVYNGTIYFAVPAEMVSRAIGPGASNIKKIHEGLGKKIKIIKESEGIEDAEDFISSIVSPVTFKNIEVKDGVMVITAGNNQNKAGLIGRNKVRLGELAVIVKDTFGLEVRIA